MKRGEMLTCRSVSGGRQVLSSRLQIAVGLLFGLIGLMAMLHFGFRVCAAVGIGGQDKSADGVWQPTRTVAGEWAGRAGVPESAVVFRLDESTLRVVLDKAPLENRDRDNGTNGNNGKDGKKTWDEGKEGGVVVWLPMPSGEFARFRVVEAPVMKPELAEQFPEIKSYRGWGMDDGRLTMRCDLSPRGFHAAITDGAELMAIHPVQQNDREHYVSYSSRSYAAAAESAMCLVNESKVIRKMSPVHSRNSSIGTHFRDYDIAIATTGEYAQAYGGGTVSGTLSSLNSWLNPLNVIYERELSIGIVLTTNNNQVIYTDDETDPFNNGVLNSSPGVPGMVDQVRAVLGSSGLNYDLGLVLGTGGGGSAYVGVVCETASDSFGPYKGGGAVLVNGSVGNTDSAHLMAHEIGHQFGATHTHNANTGCGERVGDTAWESGSGLTLMSNAGGCSGHNIANARSANFHSGSFEQIIGFLNVLGGSCAMAVETSNNPPTVDGGTDYLIPKQTPFALTAIGSDPNGDMLTYSWEQVDAGGSGFANPPYADTGDPALTTRPIFRPLIPVSSGASYAKFFPSLTYILANQNTPPAMNGNLQTAENLPQVTRTMNFRATVRAITGAGTPGGVANDSVRIDVDGNAGPFLVTSQNSSFTWPGGTQQTVTWSVTNTGSGTNVNCTNVKISLSTDGGNTFSHVLAATTPNDGSEAVTLPNSLASTQARVKVEALGNIFFDISDANFTVTTCPSISLNPTTLPNGFVGTAYSQTITATGGASPYAYALSAGSLPGGLMLSSGGTLSGNPTTTGVFNFTVTATDNNGCQGSRAYTVVISGTGLMFYPLTSPVRLLDTRTSPSSACFTPGAKIMPGSPRTQQASNTCSIPASALAVIGNATTVASAGTIKIYPSNSSLPNTENSYYTTSQNLNNVFTVGLGTDGAFKIDVSAATDVVVDISGYYAPPATGGLYFHSLPTPIRLLDTRIGATACYTPQATLTGGQEYTQQGNFITCSGVTIPSTAKALVGNATTVNPAGTGFLTLFPADVAPRPVVANGNYLQGQTLNTPFTVGLSSGSGQFKIYPLFTTDLVVDIVGYYSFDVTDINGTGLLFVPLPTPMRLLDTRSSAYCTSGPQRLATTEYTQPARGICTIGANAAGIVGNASVFQQAAQGFLTLWPSNATRPTIATANYPASLDFNRHFTVVLGADGEFKNYSLQTTHLVVDVSGYFSP